MLPLGTPLPEFSLPDVVTGRLVESASFHGEVVLVAMLCNHCPFVVHVREGFAALARDLVERGVRVVAISANDVARLPQDGPGPMAELARSLGFVFPYCYDETQDVAKAFRAMCTPEFYVFDRGGRLAYRGQMDRSRPRNGIPVTGDELRAAVDAVLAGGEPSAEQFPSMGCNIKWKPGNEPDYVR
jgi:thiol-disulfide isomerase/thioredoxin